MHITPKFVADAQHIVVRPLTLNGEFFEPGDIIPPGTVTSRRLRQLYDANNTRMLSEQELDLLNKPK